MKEAAGKDYLLPQALQSSGMEADTQISNAHTGTEILLHMVRSAPGSDGSCVSPSGSAVSALQSKFKEISQRRCKGKDTHDVPLESPSGLLQEKSDMERSPLNIPEVKIFKSSSSADELSEVQNLPMSSHLKEHKLEGESVLSFDSALGEGFRGENFTTSGHGNSVLSKPTLSPRYWTAPKGFWRAARRDTLVPNMEINSFPRTTKNVVHASQEEQKLRVGGTVVHKELHGLNTLESTFHRCLQKEQSSPSDEPKKEDISDIPSCRGGHTMEMSEPEKVQTTKTSSAMLAEGQHQPPLIIKGEIF